MIKSAHFTLPPLSTKLCDELEAMRDHITDLCGLSIVRGVVDEDSPADLRALAGLVKAFAVKADDVLLTVAREAGLLRGARAAQYERIMFGAVEGDLMFALTERAEELDEERRPKGDPNAEHSTINHRQLGLLP